MTSIRALSDLLICFASVRADPEASDFDMRSDPAKSTRDSRPDNITLPLFRLHRSLTSTSIMRTMCDLLLWSLLLVLATARLACPRRVTSSTSSGDATVTCVAPWIVTLPEELSRTSILSFDADRSLSRSCRMVYQ